MKSFKKPMENLRSWGSYLKLSGYEGILKEKGGREAMKPEGMKVISGVLPQSESAQGAERHKLFRAVQSSEETKNSF